MKKRESFNSRWGFILACIGSAVGMGNIWMFPYRVGQYGGAAFLLCGAFTALVVFIPAMDTLVCNILEIVFPIAAIAWYSFVSRHAAREYWGA